MSGVNASYDNFKRRRKFLAELLEKSRKALESLDMHDWTETVSKLGERVESDIFKVLVIGEFKRGKSTFVNAMLNEEVLPAFVTPCTAVINEIKWGVEKKAVLHFRDPLPNPLSELPKAASTHIEKGNGGISPMSINIEDLESYVCIPEPDKDQSESIAESPYDFVEVYWPLDLCRNGIEIIDSPGLNEHGTRQKITLDYMSTVDAIIFVMSCHALASHSEMRVIERNVIGAGHEDIFFVCNRFDQIREKERERLVSFGADRLGSKTSFGKSGVYFISALDALEGRLDKDDILVQSSGIQKLEADLAKFLTNDRGKAKLLTPSRELNYVLQEALLINIPGQEKMLHQDLDKLEAAYKAKQPVLQDVERSRSQIVQRINNDMMRLIDEVKSLTIIELREMGDTVPTWLEGYEPKNPIEFFSLKGLQNQIKELVSEASSILISRIEDAQDKWRKETFLPLLEKRIEEMTKNVSDRIDDLLARVDTIREDLVGVELEGLELAHSKDITGLERILAAAGGFVIGGAGAALVGATMGYQEMAKSLVPQILLTVAMLFVGIVSPFVIIPTLLIAGITQGIWKSKGTTDQVVNEVARRMADNIKNNVHENADKISTSVKEKLQPLVQAIDKGLECEIQAVRDQVEGVLKDMREGESAVQEKFKELEDAKTQLSGISASLSKHFLN